MSQHLRGLPFDMSVPFDWPPAALRDPIGLCATCRHARVIENRRGSEFYLCRLSEADARFEKYPRLPVIHCAGYEVDPSQSDPS